MATRGCVLLQYQRAAQLSNTETLWSHTPCQYCDKILPGVFAQWCINRSDYNVSRQIVWVDCDETNGGILGSQLNIANHGPLFAIVRFYMQLTSPKVFEWLCSMRLVGDFVNFKLEFLGIIVANVLGVACVTLTASWTLQVTQESMTGIYYYSALMYSLCWGAEVDIVSIRYLIYIREFNGRLSFHQFIPRWP